jgi:hypothetical protein
MYHDTTGAGPKPPLPPVRTRWKGTTQTGTAHGRGLLGPVKSGLFAAFETASPPAELESAESIAPAPAEPQPEPDQPWLDTPALEEYEAAELLLEVSVEEVSAETEELSLIEPESTGIPEVTAADGEVPGLQPIGEPIEAGEGLHTRPAPVSAWDLGARRAEADAEQLGLDRVREEWEALGQALIESLSGVTAPAPEPSQAWPAAEPETATETTADHVEGLEPIGAGLARDEMPAEAEAPAHGRAYQELAQRLEAFADALRTEGRYAITRAQLSGDRMDSMLAGFAAGWLAARGE